MKRVLQLTLIAGLLATAGYAHSNGADKKEVLSLSGGKYVETFDEDSIEQIGSVLFNVNSRKIVGFVKADDSDVAAQLKPEVISRWLSIDPLAAKHPHISPYVFGANNPIIYKDDDGRDFVYFDKTGTEVDRFKSKEYFHTYVGSEDGGWQEAAMPKIITANQLGHATTSAYQTIDYQIAASTLIFNQSKNDGSLRLVTEGGNSIPTTADAQLPNLDPTLVKAMAVDESQAGTAGTTDVMQSNVPGDWEKGKKMKLAYGLQKNVEPDLKTSVGIGIKILASKGFRDGITYDKATGISTYNFKGWEQAKDNYNGGWKLKLRN